MLFGEKNTPEGIMVGVKLGHECVEDKCAWWVFYDTGHDDGYECAIAQIARKIGG